MNGGDKSPSGLPLDSKTPESRAESRSASSPAGMTMDSAPARFTPIRAGQPRNGWLGGKQHREYLDRLDQARVLFAEGLNNLTVAARIGCKPNSIPALKRALGIEVVGYRKGSSKRPRSPHV